MQIVKIVTKGGDGYMKMYRSVAYNADLSAVDKLIWCIIVDKCDAAEHFRDDRWIELSITELARSLGVARNTALKSLHRLCDLGLIERQQSMIQGYADKYTVPEQDIVDAIIASMERHGG